MALVMVYRFRYFDRKSQQLTEAPDMGTDAAIRELGGIVIPGTGLVVEDSRVGRAGLLIRDSERRA